MIRSIKVYKSRFVGLLCLILILNMFVGTLPMYASGWNTNLTGDVSVSGMWAKVQNEGLRGTSGSGANVFHMASDQAETNFSFEADVKIDTSSPYGVASLVFRADGSGSEGYMVSLDPNLDRLRLFDYATGVTLGTHHTVLEQGSTYKVKITADGALIKVYLGPALALSVTDNRYEKGYVGFHVYNGIASFQNAYLYQTFTNITGWTSASGLWTHTTRGWNVTAPTGQNIRMMSQVTSDDFNLESTVTVMDPYAVGSLLFRSSSDGTQAYGLQVDPNMDQLRLYKTSGNVTLGVYSTAIAANQAYKIRVRAEGAKLTIYWDTRYDPVFSVTDSLLTSGLVGLQAYNGQVAFQNVFISNMDTNISSWTTASGSWTPHLHGLKAETSGASNAFRTAREVVSDIVMEGDLKVDGETPLGTAAMLFRGNAAGTSGYVVNIDPNMNLVRLFDAATGTTIASANQSIDAGRSYRVEVEARGSSIKVFLDAYATPVISVTNTKYASGVWGLNAYNGTAYFQNVNAWKWESYYAEKYRPQYHFSMPRNWISDPNGLVYYQGEYHMFAQDGGNWVHAVSTNMVNWKRLPVALPWYEGGHAWSGSAVVDPNNATGLFPNGSGMIAFYTMYHPDKSRGNQKVGIAYSRDRGRSWEYYSGNPVIENPGGVNGDWDFRDPKVLWDEERGRWVMVVSGGDHIRFFTSTNLLNWTYASSFGYGSYVYAGVWECPDFFQLPVDGQSSIKKWVLTISTGGNPLTGGSSAEYFVGTFDGTTFINDNPVGTVLRNEAGKDFYASMSFSDLPAADGRRIWIGWMSNWDYPFGFPTTDWKHMMSVPRVLSLKSYPGEGIRLVQTPIAELESLRGTVNSWSNVNLTPSSVNLLASKSGSAYEIEAEFEIPTTDVAAEFGFRLRQGNGQQTVVGYKPTSSTMFVNRADAGIDDFGTGKASFEQWQESYLPPMRGRIKMRIFVDESSIEILGNNGKISFSNTISPDPSSNGMSVYTSGGNVKVVSLKLYPMKHAWK